MEQTHNWELLVKASYEEVWKRTLHVFFYIVFAEPCLWNDCGSSISSWEKHQYLTLWYAASSFSCNSLWCQNWFVIISECVLISDYVNPVGSLGDIGLPMSWREKWLRHLGWDICAQSVELQVTRFLRAFDRIFYWRCLVFLKVQFVFFIQVSIVSRCFCFLFCSSSGPCSVWYWFLYQG